MWSMLERVCESGHVKQDATRKLCCNKLCHQFLADRWVKLENHRLFYDTDEI